MGGRRALVVSVAFYGAVTVTLALILSGLLGQVMPSGIATRIGFNSEGYLFALLLAAWIQLVRPRLAGGSGWAVTAAVAVMCGVLGVALLNSDLPSRFKTLNETLIALALIVPYVMLHRPLRPRPVRLWPAGVALLLVIGSAIAVTRSPESLAENLAETIGFVVLALVTLDVVDRGILDRAAATSRTLRWGWYGLLVAVPLTVTLLGTDSREGAGIHAVLMYLGRVHESFVGILLVIFFFVWGLGRSGARNGRAAAPTTQVQTSSESRA